MTLRRSTGTLITTNELHAALTDIQPCPDCAGGVGIHIEADGTWDAVQIHDVPCPATGVTAADYQAAYPREDQTPTTTEIASSMFDANSDVIACLAAMHRGDHQGAADILATTNLTRLAYPLLHLANTLGPAAVGPDAWIEALTTWQPGQAIGEGLADR